MTYNSEFPSGSFAPQARILQVAAKQTLVFATRMRIRLCGQLKLHLYGANALASVMVFHFDSVRQPSEKLGMFKSPRI